MPGISSNPIPKDPFEGIAPINFPHPISAVKGLFGRVKNVPGTVAALAGIDLISATYGQQGNSFSIDFKNSKAGGLLKLVRIRPVGFSDQPSLFAKGTAVDSIIFVIPRNGGQPIFAGAHHHVQSSGFGKLAPGEKQKGVTAGGFIRESKKGSSVAIRLAPLFADGLIKHGVRFVEDIADPNLALTACYALARIQTALIRPEKAFGRKGMGNGRRSSAIDGYNPFIEIARGLYDLANPASPTVDPLRAF